MIKLGINEFVRNFRRNFLVIIQISAVMVLLVLLVSMYNVQTKMGFSVMKYIDSTGVFATVNNWPENINGITNRLKDVETAVYAEITKSGNVLDANDNNIANATFVSYDENVVQYRPRLKSGVWYDEAEKVEGIINVVVAENTAGYETGDIFNVNYCDRANNDYVVKCKVVGTVYKETMLFGINTFYSVINCSYLDLFSSAADMELEIDENIPLEFQNILPTVYGIMSEEDMKKNKFFSTIEKVLIDFEDDISEEDMKGNLERMFETGLAQDTTLMEENSQILLFQKIGGILILLIVLIALSIISIISSSEVNFIYERKNYGIYFITGNSWGKTLILSAISWMCIILFSILLSVTVIAVLKVTGLAEYFTIIWTNTHIISYAIVSVVTMIIALIIPALLLRKSQPVEVLKNI